MRFFNAVTKFKPKLKQANETHCYKNGDHGEKCGSDFLWLHFKSHFISYLGALRITCCYDLYALGSALPRDRGLYLDCGRLCLIVYMSVWFVECFGGECSFDGIGL